MRFDKNVPRENREFLTEQLKQYEKETPMTVEERRDLHEWVAMGRSPYDNGSYGCYEGGGPIDFITDLRYQKEQTEWFNGLSDEEREQFLREERGEDGEDWSVTTPLTDLGDFEPDEELPFQ